MSYDEIFQTLCLLKPFDVVGIKKIRLGRAQDGGYVLLDAIQPSQQVFSYGISGEVSFDLALAERGNKIFMFDHTIEELPVQHPNFNFVREGISGIGDRDCDLSTLTDHLLRFGNGANNLILKMDVEGAEWEALGLTQGNILAQFEQVVIEVHDLNLITSLRMAH